MKKLVSLFIAALFLGASVTGAFAVQISSDGNRGDANRMTTAVFNDSGSTLTSGRVVIWDTGSGDPTDPGLGAYVTTTTSADSNLAAGVVLSDSIIDQGIGTIIIYGPAYALWAATTDGATDAVGTALGTSTIAGEYGAGSGLGVALETSANSDSGDGGTNTAGGNTKRMLIFVNPSNAE